MGQGIGPHGAIPPCRAEQWRGHPHGLPSPDHTHRKQVRGAWAQGLTSSGQVAPTGGNGPIHGPHEPRFVLTAPTGWQWNGEPVQHSRLNSEHIPRPTHNIRNIIRQCQPTSRGPQPHRYPQALH